eukprot:1141463-Pelagomonas_calceolata.AAC.1
MREQAPVALPSARGPVYKNSPKGSDKSNERVKREQDGEYKAKKRHGLTKKWQPGTSLPTAPYIGSRKAAWRTSGASLQDQQTSECQAHESGKQHKDRAAAWQQAQDKASWQQRMGKGAKQIAQRHAGQAAGPNLHTLQIASTT